ncbi:MAG: alpha/beta fold hydrolase [Chloroflexi bacterium]|nr:alpha/beta fold hydrolase [Chloroflexota bacterium]
MNIAASALLPSGVSEKPPVLLVHGAANSAVVWRYWQRELVSQGYPTYALDLRGHGNSVPFDLSGASMADYADDVTSVVAQLKQPPVVIGWSMGGLVGMMAAASGGIAACVGLETSPPARHVDVTVPLREGTFDSTEYGIVHTNPKDQPEMPDLSIAEREIALSSLGQESRYARDDRKRGNVIETLPCPLLVVKGVLQPDWTARVYDDSWLDGLWLEADVMPVDPASHWGLVLSESVLSSLIPDVLDWMEAHVGQGAG